MKAWHIDATAQTVRLVDYADGCDLRRLIGGFPEMAYRWPRTGDVLYVDEEGLLKAAEVRLATPCFLFLLRPDQPLFGNGVVVGREIELGAGGLVETAYPTIGERGLRLLVMFRW